MIPRAYCFDFLLLCLFMGVLFCTLYFCWEYAEKPSLHARNDRLWSVTTNTENLVN